MTNQKPLLVFVSSIGIVYDAPASEFLNKFWGGVASFIYENHCAIHKRKGEIESPHLLGGEVRWSSRGNFAYSQNVMDVG